jgi:predicted  nucleic acid-binding Zn-ribbon protein
MLITRLETQLANIQTKIDSLQTEVRDLRAKKAELKASLRQAKKAVKEGEAPPPSEGITGLAERLGTVISENVLEPIADLVSPVKEKTAH